ncbi:MULTISPECIES: DUF6355 family natural product biosynthesis protein [unclassified Pseudarthrobacter]|uniref:DUF6355 family natural product biosynthesis protein n=1 Tax=unclassified Pseudarthrobacter TaxID=2647000 RepID=UPI0036431668
MNRNLSSSRKKNTAVRRIAALFALSLSLLVWSVPSANAASPSTVAASTPCGFHMEGILAHYNHCTADGSNVYVQVTSIVAPGSPPGLGGGLTLLCLSPGNHSLVPYVYGIITGAHSNGVRCSQPNG